MIQLRWLEYESPSNPETGEHFIVPSKYRKLQYRQEIKVFSFGVMVNDWDEWRDVPTIPDAAPGMPNTRYSKGE